MANNKIEQITSKTVDASKTIEQNESKKIKAGTAKYFLTCIENLRVEYPESISLSTTFGINTAKQIYTSATDK